MDNDSKPSLDQAIHTIPKIYSQLDDLTYLVQSLIKQESVPTLLSLEEVAQVFGIAKATLKNWVYQRKIAAIKVGGLRFTPMDIEEFIKKHKIRARRN